MGLEIATTISGLVATNPTPDDAVSQGDDHLNLIKSVLKAQFPGAGLNGFAIPIIATETELNYSDGLTGNIQDQIDAIITGTSGALNAPLGTVFLFGDNYIPPGWTQVTSNNDQMIRVVSGSGGGTGGNMSPISMDIDHDHTTDPHTLSLQQIPAHAHGVFADTDSDDDLASNFPYASANYDAGTTGANSYTMKGVASPLPTLGKTSDAGGSGGNTDSHNHGNTGVLNMTLTPKYLNMILGIKDDN